MMLVEQGGGERMGEGGQSIEIEIEIEIDGEIGRWLKVDFWAVGETRMFYFQHFNTLQHFNTR